MQDDKQEEKIQNKFILLTGANPDLDLMFTNVNLFYYMHSFPFLLEFL